MGYTYVVARYYLSGKAAKVEDFLNPSTMNVLQQEISDLKQALRDVGHGDAKVWLGETGACLKFLPGERVLSENYVAGFLYADDSCLLFY